MSALVKVGIYAAILAAFLGSVAWYGSNRYTAGRNDLLAEQSAQAQEARKADDLRTKASDEGAAQAKTQGEQAQAASVENTRTVVQTVTRIVHDTPAPAVCVVRPDSVRELSAAIERANAAARGVSGAQSSREASADVH